MSEFLSSDHNAFMLAIAGAVMANLFLILSISRKGSSKKLLEELSGKQISWKNNVLWFSSGLSTLIFVALIVWYLHYRNLPPGYYQ